MNIVPFFLYLVGFFVLVQLITIGLLVKIYLGIRFKLGTCRLCEPTEMPGYIHDVFSAYVNELSKLGFEIFHCQISQEPIVSQHSEKWNLVLLNKDQAIYATLSASPMPDKNSPVRVEFLTFFSDDTKLLTVNGIAHEIIGQIPNHIVIDKYVESTEKQYQAHMDMLTSLQAEKSPQLVTCRHFACEETKSFSQYLEGLENSGIIKLKGEMHQMRFFPALRHAIKSMKGKQKYKAMQAKRKKNLHSQNITQPEVPIEVEIDAFDRLQNLLENKPGGQLGKLIIFIISMLLFMVSFKIAFSLKTVFIFVGVVFIHEMGHMLGMYLFRYKDVQVMFLPFLGAATIGSDKKATAFQQVIVYLLGPWPGIVLGTVCIVLNNVYPSEPLFEFGTFMLVLNYINLLPILPLDGGRVFELILFSRASVLRTIFLLTSIIILGLAGIATHSPIMMIIPVFLIISLPLQWINNRTHSKLMKKIKDENLDLEDRTLKTAIFSILKEKSFSKLSFEQKYQTAKMLLNNAVKRPPTIGISILSFFIYLVVWITPLFVVFTSGAILVLSGSSSNYDQGVIDYYTFPDSDKVCVTNFGGLLSSFSFVLDENGNVVSDLGKNATFVSKETIWQPGAKSVLFEINSFWGSFGKQKTKSSPLYLRNIESNEQIEIERPDTPENCYYGYSRWSRDGSYLMGTKNIHSEDFRNNKQTFFVHNIQTDTIEEIKTETETEDFYPIFTSTGNVFFRSYSDEEETDNESANVTVYNISAKQKTEYTLPKDTLSWETTTDGTALITIQKLFENNTVSFQVIEINLADNSQKILFDKTKLPSHTFEDAAKGKQSQCFVELSPANKWVMCTATDNAQKTTKWLLNRNNGNCCKLFELNDKNTYLIGMTYSADENRICVNKSSTDYLNPEGESSGNCIEVYEISENPPTLLRSFECDENGYTYQFFGNDQLLYIKQSEDNSFFKNKNELWAININDGTKRKFIQSDK